MESFFKNNQINPVNAYLLTLNSQFSINTYKNRLEIFCDFLFKTRNFDQCDWSALDYISVLKYMRYESNNNKAYTTINITLSAIKDSCNSFHN